MRIELVDKSRQAMMGQCTHLLAVTYAFLLCLSATQARPVDSDGLPGLFINSIGMEFVRVERKSGPGATGSQPFYIGRYEVTVGQFERFEEESGYRAEYHVRTRYTPTDAHPVAGVSYRDAVAFAGWLTAKDGLSYRLPKVSEWEIAAGGSDGRSYPWGSDPGRAGIHGNWGRGWRALSLGWLPTLVPVGSSPLGRSEVGAEDMIGNVSEWCEWDGVEERPSESSRKFPQHPLKGGCWTYPEPARICDHTVADDNQGYKCFGFRLLLEMSEVSNYP